MKDFEDISTSSCDDGVVPPSMSAWTLMPPWLRKASTKHFKGTLTEPRRRNPSSPGFNCLRVNRNESDMQIFAHPHSVHHLKATVWIKKELLLLRKLRCPADVSHPREALHIVQINLKQDSFAPAGAAPKFMGATLVTACRGKTWPQEPPTHLVELMVTAWKKHSTVDNASFTVSIQSLTEQIDEFGMFLQKTAIISAQCGVDFTINIIGGVVVGGPRNVTRVCAPVFDDEVVGLPSWYHAWASATVDDTMTSHLRILPTLQHRLWAKRWGTMVDLQRSRVPSKQSISIRLLLYSQGNHNDKTTVLAWCISYH